MLAARGGASFAIDRGVFVSEWEVVVKEIGDLFIGHINATLINDFQYHPLRHKQEPDKAIDNHIFHYNCNCSKDY